MDQINFPILQLTEVIQGYLFPLYLQIHNGVKQNQDKQHFYNLLLLIANKNQHHYNSVGNLDPIHLIR